MIGTYLVSQIFGKKFIGVIEAITTYILRIGFLIGIWSMACAMIIIEML